ncbi:MAG: DDE-type integrase/transposase/recombinase [Rhizobiales bacterium]|nr:DDE-type integrase/transposase/recombinase [Hyphomicrobiales bacterium]
MSRLNIGLLDRIREESSNVQRRVISKSDAGFVMARVGDGAGELHETFTHQQIHDLLAANVIRIDRGWFEEGRARARLLAGVSSLNELPIDEANEMLWRQYYLDAFLKREGMNKSVKRTDKCIAETLRAIDAERPVTAGRCDQKIESRRPPSARTFRRWLRVYEDNCFDLLALRKHYRKSGNAFSGMHPEAERIMNRHVLAYCDERRKSIANIYNEMRAEFMTVNDEREQAGKPVLTCPAKSTLSHRIKALNAFEVYASRCGVAKARAKFAVVGTGLDVVRPLQHVQIDEWTLQLHTIADHVGLSDHLTEADRIKMKKERVKVCVVLDLATRCILAMRLSPRADAANAIATLAMVVTDKNPIAKAAGCLSDWPMTGTFGLISPDAGSAFIDEGFRACVAGLKATYENAPAGLSWLRGHIERTFGTMHTTLMPNFPGRSFSSIADLGEYKAEDRAAVFTRMLPQVFVRWAVDYYHHTPHAGLGGETPYAAWQRLTATYGVDAPPNAHQRREIFGTDLDRALDQRGLRACGVYYQSAALQEWRRKVGDTTVCLRHDSSDIGHVSVWIGEQWLTVPSVRDMFRGLDLSTWLTSARDLKRRYAANAKIHEKIALAAVRAISAMAEDAMRRTSIDATRLTRDELDREERHLFLGFDIVDDVDPDDVSLKSNILDGGVAVKSATTPTQPIQHPQPQDGSANEADDFGLED